MPVHNRSDYSVWDSLTFNLISATSTSDIFTLCALNLLRANWLHTCTVFFIKIDLKLYITNQGYNFPGGSFSNRDNVRAPNPIYKRTSTQAS